MTDLFAALPGRIAQASRRPKSLGANTGDAISLAMGEPFADTAAPIREAAIAALNRGRTRYTQLTGLPKLREAIAESVAQETLRSVTPEEVVVTHGGSAGLAATVLATIGAGDRVILPEPTYSLYVDHIAMVDAVPIGVPWTAEGRIDLEAIDNLAATARMLVLCNPSNPTGLVATPDELRALANILSRNPGLLLLSDEAYSSILFDERTFVSALEFDAVRDRVIVCRTFSKSYAMTGWRLGYIVAPPDVASSINLVHRTINGALNTFVQDAGIQALETPAEVNHSMVEAYQSRRDLVMEALDGLPGVSLHRPEGAFYAFPRIAGDRTSDELVEEFAKGGVLLRSGTEFGASAEGHVRLSFATDVPALSEGLRRLVHVVRAL